MIDIDHGKILMEIKKHIYTNTFTWNYKEEVKPREKPEIFTDVTKKKMNKHLYNDSNKTQKNNLC